METLIKDFLVESSQSKAERVYGMTLSCVDLMKMDLATSQNVGSNVATSGAGSEFGDKTPQGEKS